MSAATKTGRRSKTQVAMPTWVPPIAPLEVSSPPSGPVICEVKWDGYRLLAFKDGDVVRTLTRNDNDMTRQVPGLVDALKALPCRRAIMDGELVVLGADGHSRFHAIRSALGGRTPGKLPLFYMAFDLLYLDDEDLREQPIEERKRRLQKLVAGSTAIRYVEHLEGQAAAMFDYAMRTGLEGIVCKKPGSRYREERGVWLKVKCRQERPLLVGGYRVDDAGQLSELLVGLDVDGNLIYLGAVSGGLGKLARELRPRLEALRRNASPFAEQRGPRDAAWVRPEASVVVRFTATSTGHLRHPVLVGVPRPGGEPR